jgi:hypothetical protein
MEDISRMVSDSLARNGVEPSLDHLRLEWSRWFRCESSFSVLLAPSKPGIFALGEEMISPVDGSKRMLALFQIAETADLGFALGRLFLPGSPLRERLAAGRCFARYTVIEEADQRSSAYKVFQRWMEQSTEAASGISPCGAGARSASSGQAPAREAVNEENVSDATPSMSFALGGKAQDRESFDRVRRPASLPLGF